MDGESKQKAGPPAARIAAELERHQAEVELLIANLKAQIEALPDNPRITRLSGQAFTINSRDLHSNWTVAHHDFKQQYRMIATIVEKADPSNAVAVIQRAITTGAIRPDKAHSSTIRLHPDVIAHLRGLLGQTPVATA